MGGWREGGAAPPKTGGGRKERGRAGERGVVGRYEGEGTRKLRGRKQSIRGGALRKTGRS